MKKHGQKKPSQAPPDSGPLAWLADFTSFGLDASTPRPPFSKIFESRSLGLDALRRGYVFDKHRPFDVYPMPAVPNVCGPGDIVIQHHREVVKKWFRPAGSDRLIPLAEPVNAPDHATLFRFLTKYRARAIMPNPFRSDEAGMFLWTVESGGEDREVTDEEATQVVDAVLEVMHLVRSHFLHFIWMHEQSSDKERPLTERLLAWLVMRVVTYCSRDENARHPMLGGDEPNPAKSHDIQKMMLALLAYVDSRIWRWRAPVTSTFTDPATCREPVWVGVGVFGVLWAEVLNAFQFDRASWPLLRCCGRCGRFWVLDKPTRRGRQRELCSDTCRKRFHARAPGEKR